MKRNVAGIDHGTQCCACTAGFPAGAALFVLAVLACGPVTASSGDDAAAGRNDADCVKLAASLSPHVVRVEYTLRPDKGDEPDLFEYPDMPEGRHYRGEGSDYVEMERPYECCGYLLSPTRIVSRDVAVHPRFVEKIEVAWGDRRVGAKVTGYARDCAAVFLELDKPLEGAKALKFDPASKGPYYLVVGDRFDGRWCVLAYPFNVSGGVGSDGKPVVLCGGRGLAVDAEGRAVGVVLRREYAAAEAWKVRPEQWAVVDTKQESLFRRKTTEVATAGILKVRLNFRSPDKQSADSYGGGDGQSATEQYVSGLLVSSNEMLVLADLKREDTARLEQVLASRGDSGDKPLRAEFAYSLRDYAAFVARFGEPVEGALAVSVLSPADLKHRMLMGADIRLQGSDRMVYYCHERITGLEQGWKQLLHPFVARSSENLFLFDENAGLVAFPMGRRSKVGERDRSEWTRGMQMLASQVLGVLGDAARHADPDNVPVAEKQEHRRAWMGMHTQSLGPELARFNKVSHLTSDGASGVLVCYVYADSPADKAGVKPGWILLRLHVEGYPKPVEIVEADRYGRPFSFPWSHLDGIPVEAFEHAPVPWESMDNTLTRMLTDIGFGKKYKAEFFVDGRIVEKDFETVECPMHYERAPRYKAPDRLGLTVRDMTFEVRRYFQKKPDECGVIISKVEPSGKAATAGIKYFEIITHVNDTPVFNVGDFEKAILNQDELKFAVKRMTTGRLVRIRMNGDAGNPAPEDDGSGEGDPGVE